MKVAETPIAGLVVLEPKVFGDERGFFMETFNEAVFRSLGLPTNFVQDNHSRSSKGVLRGLHFQNPNPQGKLVRVTAGRAWDVAVDLRAGSPTFGRHFGVELSASNKKMFWIPEGFAHGFLSLEDGTDFLYKCTRLYSPADDGGLRWNDPVLGIAWPLAELGEAPVISAKDSQLPFFGDWKASGRKF